MQALEATPESTEMEAASAAFKGDLATLQTLAHALDSWTTFNAAMNGHLDCLRFACDAGCSISVLLGAYVSSAGVLTSLTYLCENKLIELDGCLVAAARNGRLDCLQYLHEKMLLPLDVEVMIAAAANGHLACMQYANAHGAPWDLRVCQAAIDHADCLAFAWESGCTLESDNTAERPSKRFKP